MIRSLVIACLCLAADMMAVAQTEDRTETVTVFNGFVPEITRLEPISGAEMRAYYATCTIKGLYKSGLFEDQRFSERFQPDGQTQYDGPGAPVLGDWFVLGDQICFVYPEDAAAGGCFWEYRYGSCTISYQTPPWPMTGRPLLPSAWTAIHVTAEPGFAWPEGEVEAFTCERQVVERARTGRERL